MDITCSYVEAALFVTALPQYLLRWGLLRDSLRPLGYDAGPRGGARDAAAAAASATPKTTSLKSFCPSSFGKTNCSAPSSFSAFDSRPPPNLA